MMQIREVESDFLGKSFVVADNEIIMDSFCPIDRTRLVGQRNYGNDNFMYCKCCDAHYPYGVKDPAILENHARGYLARKIKERKRLSEDIDSIDKIVELAVSSGLLK